MTCKVDLPWQSTNKRSLEAVMCPGNIAGLFEMAVCCAKPPYLLLALLAQLDIGKVAPQSYRMR
jgi:hypothetical protein